MIKVTNKAAILAFFDQYPQLNHTVLAKSRKYVTFYHMSEQVNYYVGNKGAIRIGKTVAASVPINETIRRDIIALGKKLLS